MENSTENEKKRLLDLHQKVLLAHLNGDVELLLTDESDDYIIARRGEISHPAKEERRQQLAPYLQATHFVEYRDEVPPVVKVSQDGSLGWVTVQVFARGDQLTASGERKPIQFVSAWIELYERREQQWLRIGNVSNFKP